MKSDSIVLILLLAVGAANAFLSVYTVWQARGFRRVLAILPLLGIVGICLNIYLDVARDPTAHNLWPFELLLAGAAGLLYSFGFLGLQALWSQKPKDRGRERET